MEDLTIRRRNPLRRHYTLTSNVLLFGYRALSDGAKLTYQVIDSFDWGDVHGLRKGYAFPSVPRVAQLRGVSDRTIQRHILELIGAGLLTKEERPGDTNILYIEDMSNEQMEAYASEFARGDTNVTRPVTDMSPEERQREERPNNVNEDASFSGQERELQPIANTVHEKVSLLAKRRPRKPSERARTEHLAQVMLAVLKDEHSLGYYRRTAREQSPQVIFEVLGLVKETALEGKVRKSRGALFVDILKRRRGLSTRRAR